MILRALHHPAAGEVRGQLAARGGGWRIRGSGRTRRCLNRLLLCSWVTSG